MEVGVTACDIEGANISQSVISNAVRCYCLVDHSKFQSPSLYKIVPFEAVQGIVTDRAPSAEWMEFLKQTGIDVILP